jgi:hypothetical protein
MAEVVVSNSAVKVDRMPQPPNPGGEDRGSASQRHFKIRGQTLAPQLWCAGEASEQQIDVEFANHRNRRSFTRDIDC